jgi:hypothetical protein
MNLGYGPVGGRYFDEIKGNPVLDIGVFWSGKTVEKIYENHTGVTKIVFTDGSWADMACRQCHNAGPGDLAIGDEDFNLLAG